MTDKQNFKFGTPENNGTFALGYTLSYYAITQSYKIIRFVLQIRRIAHRSYSTAYKFIHLNFKFAQL